MPFLQFKGKTAVATYHHSLPHHALEFDAELSIGDGNHRPTLTGNLLIEGDNLLALKALLPTHAGKVKCIYIDPPYNTGNEGWVYNDNLTQPVFKEWIGQVVGNDETDPSRHDKWCCMMYPRLNLLKELLREDGVIFVSIDHNEIHHLRLLMNEVFGENNFIAELVWEKTRKNDATLISVGHEYILAYANSLAFLKSQKTVWREPKPGAADIMREYRRLRSIHGEDDKAIEKELREWYKSLPKSNPAKKLSRYKHIDKNGPWRDRDISWPGGGGPRYDVIHPVTRKPCRVPDTGWRYSHPETMQRYIEVGAVVFREDDSEPPFRKAHLAVVADELLEDDTASVEETDADEPTEEDNEEVGLQVMPSVIYKQSQVAVKYLRSLMDGTAFNNPKDHEIIARLLRLCTSREGGDIVLDAFAGSGTTAQAVLHLNNEDGGDRHFILVQQPFDSKKDEAEKRNIARTVTRERLRRVISGVNTPALPGSFAFVHLSDKPLLGEYRDLGDHLPVYEEIARYIYFTETSDHWNSDAANRETGRIGQHKGTAYYLLYTPNAEEDGTLDRNFLKNVAAQEHCSKLVVYCEKFWIHRDELREWEALQSKSVRHMLVPFNLK